MHGTSTAVTYSTTYSKIPTVAYHQIRINSTSNHPNGRCFLLGDHLIVLLHTQWIQSIQSFVNGTFMLQEHRLDETVIDHSSSIVLRQHAP